MTSTLGGSMSATNFISWNDRDILVLQPSKKQLKAQVRKELRLSKRRHTKSFDRLKQMIINSSDNNVNETAYAVDRGDQWIRVETMFDELPSAEVMHHQRMQKTNYKVDGLTSELKNLLQRSKSVKHKMTVELYGV